MHVCRAYCHQKQREEENDDYFEGNGSVDLHVVLEAMSRSDS
jgi:hypothetical protein